MKESTLAWTGTIKRDVLALWIAARDPRTPWYAKAAAAIVAAYALSPIDLIPDFIPVLGYLDEVVLLPIAIALIVRMIPPDLMQEYRRAAASPQRPVSKTGMIAIILMWLLAAGGLALLLWPEAEGSNGTVWEEAAGHGARSCGQTRKA